MNERKINKNYNEKIQNYYFKRTAAIFVAGFIRTSRIIRSNEYIY